MFLGIFHYIVNFRVDAVVMFVFIFVVFACDYCHCYRFFILSHFTCIFRGGVCTARYNCDSSLVPVGKLFSFHFEGHKNKFKLHRTINWIILKSFQLQIYSVHTKSNRVNTLREPIACRSCNNASIKVYGSVGPI